MEKEEKRLYPGDIGYKGGTTNATIVINGQSKNAYTVKDANGDVKCMIVTNKILGIF